MDETEVMAEGLSPWLMPQGRGGGFTAVDEAAGTAELSLPWTWSWDGVEGSPPWTRPRDGGGFAAVDEVAGTRGRGRRCA
jgi:hypothetical protein